MKRLAFLAFLLSAGLWCQAAAALPTAKGDTVLSVTGAITERNAGAEALFDAEMLEALPHRRIRTRTRWTEGLVTFDGFLLKDLMAVVGATGTEIEARALNDYAVTIPLSDADRFPVIVATHKDGEPLRVRDKGPLWIVYDLSSEGLSSPASPHDAKMIWHLTSIALR